MNIRDVYTHTNNLVLNKKTSTDDLVNTHGRPEKSFLSLWAQPTKGELK